MPSALLDACAITIRKSLPAKVRQWLASGNFTLALLEAAQTGFEKVFVHTRYNNKMGAPKGRFDWVLGGRSSPGQFLKLQTMPRVSGYALGGAGEWSCSRGEPIIDDMECITAARKLVPPGFTIEGKLRVVKKQRQMPAGCSIKSFKKTKRWSVQLHKSKLPDPTCTNRRLWHASKWTLTGPRNMSSISPSYAPVCTSVVTPRMVLMPAAWDKRGGNFARLDRALVERTTAVTSSLIWDESGTRVPQAPPDPTPENFRVLVIAGSDMGLRASLQWIKTVQSLGYFHRILFEALDEYWPGVHVCPIGFNIDYTHAHGKKRIVQALLDPTPVAEKKRTFLAAWGKHWPGLDGKIQSRKLLDKWLKKTTIGNRKKVQSENWWRTLSQYRFQICPTGAGVQAPKVQESWLSNNIPIVNREPAFVELKRWGYPIVIVDSWDEITVENMTQWWDQLSPMLGLARWMLVADVWFAFVTQPCPITDIATFLKQAGLRSAP